MNHDLTHQCLVLCIVLLATAFSVRAGDMTPQQLRERGLEALKAAQADEARIVEAARFLSLAADAYAVKGEETAAEELNAYLYWAKKKMTLQQMDAFLTGGEPEKKVAARLEAVATAKPEVSEAKAKLQKAEAFLAANPSEPLLCAIRFYEVADRFAGTPESLEAQHKSLDLMQKVKAAAPAVVTAPVAAPAKATPKSDGRVYTYNLLGMVNIQRDACVGQWSMNNGVLSRTAEDACHTIRLAVLPTSDEYQLRATVKTSGPVGVALMFIYRGKPAIAYFDVDGTRDMTSFEMEGQRYNSNPTSVRGKFLHPCQPNEVVLTVRNEVLTLAVNGKVVTSVKPGAQGALQGSGAWPLGKLALGLGAWGGNTASFQSIQLMCSGAQAKPNTEP